MLIKIYDYKKIVSFLKKNKIYLSERKNENKKIKYFSIDTEKFNTMQEVDTYIRNKYSIDIYLYQKIKD